MGKCLVQSILLRGDYVIATVRKKGCSDDFAITNEQRDRLRVVVLDVTESEESIGKVIHDAGIVWGRIDVLVNNAGYSAKALMEEGG